MKCVECEADLSKINGAQFGETIFIECPKCAERYVLFRDLSDTIKAYRIEEIYKMLLKPTQQEIHV